MLDLYNILHNHCPWPNGVCDELDQGSYLEGQGQSAHVSKFMSKYCKLGYCPPPFTKVGDIKTHSSVCLSVCHKDFNLAHIFWSINDRALIFGMHDPCDMSFQLVPCGDLDLLPTSRSNLLLGGGPQFFELSCFRWGKILRKCNTDFTCACLFRDSSAISKAVYRGCYIRLGVIFPINAQSRKTRKLSPRKNVHVYSSYFSLVRRIWMILTVNLLIFAVD